MGSAKHVMLLECRLCLQSKRSLHSTLRTALPI